ncbi:MAG: VOC family protein [Cellulomonas sp.]|nr:VOC family protein [Cellulomonas sp.]
MSGLDHIGLNVPDVPAAAAFLVEAFGARELFSMDPFADPAAMTRIGGPSSASLRLTMLQLGGGRVELLGWAGEGVSADAVSSDSSLPGGAHLAVEVDDVAATLERVGAMAGVEVLSEPVTFTEGPTPGLTNAFLRTGWGLLVELVSWG